jgi:hypothetical protein
MPGPFAPERVAHLLRNTQPGHATDERKHKGADDEYGDFEHRPKIPATGPAGRALRVRIYFCRPTTRTSEIEKSGEHGGDR